MKHKVLYYFYKFSVTESDEKYEERLEALRAEALNGQIELIDVGDDGSWCLVISGKSKGEVWFVCGEGVGPC